MVVSGERAPVEQEVVEVEQLGRPLALAVGAEDPSELVQVGEAPGEVLGEHVRKLTLSVHGARVDVGEGGLAGKAGARLGKTQLLTDHVHEISAVGRVDDGELGR